jgi:spermidine/putrescine-binding protein
MELVKKITDAGICAGYPSWSGEWINSFKEGKVVVAISGSFLASAMKEWMCQDLKGDWRVALVPGPTYALSDEMCAVIPDSIEKKRKLKAWKVIEFLCTHRYAQEELARSTAMLPVLASLYDQKFLEYEDPYFGGEHVNSIFANVLSKIPETFITQNDGIAMQWFYNALEMVVDEKKPVEVAYEFAKRKIREDVRK